MPRRLVVAVLALSCHSSDRVLDTEIRSLVGRDIVEAVTANGVPDRTVDLPGAYTAYTWIERVNAEDCRVTLTTDKHSGTVRFYGIRNCPVRCDSCWNPPK